MSGGVDSSVAAYLLKQAGYEVIGIHMSLWCEQKHGIGSQHRQCCSVEDMHDAEAVCRTLQIPFYVLNFQEEFLEHVVEYFCREYGAGRTPNPCLVCNEQLKFGLLLRRALALDATYLATGHYARIQTTPDGYELLKGIDAGKDQSYFLYMLGQFELAHLLFPVGDRTKDEVRCIAEQASLPVAEKPDSVEICFVPHGDYRHFVGARVPQSPGEIVDLEGNVLGRHTGLASYTIGQRHGLGLGGGGRMYVVGIDSAGGRLVVGPESGLYCSSLFATDARWVKGHAPQGSVEVTAKIRYRSQEARATVTPKGNGVILDFAKPQRAVAPGQAVVFYSGDKVLGGAIIERATANGQGLASDGTGRAPAAGGRL
ncbi:MAG: tRNA 2-thiouridine(34) synthase MnmA [Chloroflexi bacterium]|nr:tRNA 2-thiouridine(34) synthase MnmA [Chloroflexota bacterium]